MEKRIEKNRFLKRFFYYPYALLHKMYEEKLTLVEEGAILKLRKDGHGRRAC